MNIAIILFSALVLALMPENALAWGPGVHLALGQSVLANLAVLPPVVAGLIARHNNAFLYGCLSADIFIGKGTEFTPGHSHNWVTGFKLLGSARDARVIAYAYGYMTHLAADVVAHNYYVPNALWNMASGSKLSHVYVEAQADQRFPEERESALALFRHPNRDNDSTLLTAMERKKLPFLLKKQIVKGSLKVTGSKEWSRSLKLADKLLPTARATRQLDEMVDLSRNVVFDFLRAPKQTVALGFDPIGSRNLRTVRTLRLDKSRDRNGSGLFTPPETLTCLRMPEVFQTKFAATIGG